MSKEIQVIICRGMQASGKSTWAENFVARNQDYKRVSRDHLRHKLMAQKIKEYYNKL